MSRHLMTKQHHRDIALAPDHHGLLIVAIDILNLLPDPIGMVCGPISTGGLGSVEANVKRFNEAIDSLHGMDVTIFNQMPFEAAPSG